MSNLLALPFKKTWPVDVKTPARQYISDHVGTHPDEFRDDIKQWQDLRKDAVAETVHEDQVERILLYQAQLVSLLSKLPPDIDLSISYAHVFLPNSVPQTLNNIAFDRASVIFNLAALFSKLGAMEDRSTPEGIKRAAQNFQRAAGSLGYLYSTLVPKLSFPSEEERPADLSKEFLQALEYLFLGQAQECSWQLAKLSQYRNTLIAKISARVSSLYGAAASTIQSAPSAVQKLFPSDWIAHIQAKDSHFAAVAEYRESMVEYEASRYGGELARLIRAHEDAQKAYDIARKGRISTVVLQDIQSLLETVKKSHARSQRDNDLIYHQDVPSGSALPAIPETNLVSSLVPPGLINPSSVLGARVPLFNDLVGWGAQEAINIYNDRKQNLVQDNIVDAARGIKDEAEEQLRKLNLPASLEALERPIGLPPSLLKKAEEVRIEDGPTKIEASIEDVQRLAHHDITILDEALDILDNEASEDEAARKELPLTRLSSHEANVELIDKSVRYRSVLTQAGESDESVRQKWDEWEDSIRELTLDEAILEASIPSSTVSATANLTREGQKTRSHARELRVKLEELEMLHRDCEQLVYRARSLAEVDDIRERVFTSASGFEKLAELRPEMFEDTLGEELLKYDKFLVEIGDLGRKQKDILETIQNINKEFLDSRKHDPAVKERERALQSLDQAYYKYREITRNLEEGFQFYNDLAGILTQFKEVCKAWSQQRNQELHSFSRSFKSLSIRDRETESSPVPTREQTPTPTSQTRKAHVTPGKALAALPPLDSSEWGFEDIKLPPPPPRSNK